MKTSCILMNVMAHQGKAFLRSASRGWDVASKVMFGFMITLVMLNLLGVGLFLKQYLQTAAPGENPVQILSAGILYYLAADLVLRFFLQRMPVQIIRPYLPVPVGRRHLIHLLLVRSAFSFFNLLPLLVVVPFVSMVGTAYHSSAGLGDRIFTIYGILGALGCLLHRPLMHLLVAQTARQKYRMAMAFRES